MNLAFAPQLWGLNMTRKVPLTADATRDLLRQATHALAALRGDMQALAPRQPFPAENLLQQLLSHFDIRPPIARAKRRRSPRE